jgi:photosystem II stability/assembly factor-like uncharacterized protein
MRFPVQNIFFVAPRLIALMAATLGTLRAGEPPTMLLLDAARANGGRVVAIGERGTIIYSQDNGRTWNLAHADRERMAVHSAEQRDASLPGQPAAAEPTLTAVSFAPPENRFGWAVGHDALILATNEGGGSWQKQWQGENLSDSFLDVLALDTRHVIAVGAYGLFLSTADGGKTWVRRKILDEDAHLNRLTRGPTGTLYLAGEHGTLLRSVDGGAKWSRIAAPYDGSFYGILPLDRRTLIAHGLRGRLFRSTDDGATWEPIVTPQPVLLATALQLQSNTLLIAGQSRGLLVSRDYGHKFSAWDVPLATAVAKLIELPDGSVLAVGEAGATLLPKP